jgi:WhiB family redox-sensing transcriptional regulator
VITRPDPEAVVCLLVKVLAGSPRLPGALCRNPSPEVFDGETEADVAEAIALCQQCPALTPCQTWLLGLKPSKRPLGVVAAQINRGPEERERRTPGRPRKADAS